mmetsp:Transcript_5370/g.12979  ORF Transcript_5370/g.12979 Transcript_5370/m.12979 type:complete len:202 (+) Transcript_5370:433-1038(+)
MSTSTGCSRLLLSPVASWCQRPIPQTKSAPLSDTAADVSSPAAMATIFTPRSAWMRFGRVSLSRPPCPSCPSWFSPHEYTSPPASTASVWRAPHATAITLAPASAATWMGTAVSASPPGSMTPSWPCLLEPHVLRSPLRVTAAECQCPQDAMATGPRPSTSSRKDSLCRSPRPSCPVSPKPQDRSRPVTVTSIVWAPPATI